MGPNFDGDKFYPNFCSFAPTKELPFSYLYQAKSDASVTWRAITRSLNHAHGGFGWNTASGTEVWLWSDTWLTNGPLCLLVEDIEPNEIVWRVADIINEEGQWETSCIQTELPPPVLQRIQEYHRDVGLGKSDQNVWKGNIDGNATARSLFQFLNFL